MLSSLILAMIKGLFHIHKMFQAVDLFTALADKSTKVPKLICKQYADFSISEDEWEMLQLIQEVLQVRLGYF
jgi:hypothetical protein